MSDFTDAFDELLDANDEACGSKQYAKVNRRKVRAIIEEITTEEIIIAGGLAESGGFRIIARKADFASKPEKGDAIEARDQDLEVMSVVNRNDVTYEITAGEFASTDQ